MAANPTHTRLAQTATRLIAANGRAVRLERDDVIGGPSYNPVTTPQDIDATAVQTRFTVADQATFDIKRTDKAFLMASAVDPREWKRFIDGGDELTIVDAQVIAPGEVTIIYKVQVRA